VIEVVEPAVELALDLERSVVHRVRLGPDHENERRHDARYSVHLDQRSPIRLYCDIHPF
jgi:hypothetical protein